MSLTRPEQGGVVFGLGSDNPDRPWVLSAAMRPLDRRHAGGRHRGRNVSTRDILLALRLNEGDIDAESAVIGERPRGNFSDGTPQRVQGQLVAERGSIVDRGGERRIPIDHAEFRFNWDARRRALVVPFQIQSGGNQFTMRAALRRPPTRAASGCSTWRAATR